MHPENHRKIEIIKKLGTHYEPTEVQISSPQSNINKSTLINSTITW
jgi:hypothetical protein